MPRPNPIRAIMEAPLPTRTYQRRKLYRPGPDDVLYAYNIINRHVFDNQLVRPKIVVKQIKGAWGHCVWHNDYKDTWAHSVITLSDKWFCPQWFMNVLAHEMVHQWEWLNNDNMTHGPQFFLWRQELSKFGIHLGRAYRIKHYRLD
jgi:hypothetical protein